MKSIRTPATAPIENEEFWQYHNQMYTESGLTRSKYCRQNKLNYDQFSYWLKKQLCNKNKSTKLVSVKVKPDSQPTAAQSILCTLNLKSGHCLKIHDISALSIILDRMN